MFTPSNLQIQLFKRRFNPPEPVQHEAIKEWLENLAKEDLDKSLKTAPTNPNKKRQYYYKNNHCLAPNPDHPACICWHDENTGPLAGEQRTLTWRIKSC